MTELTRALVEFRHKSISWEVFCQRALEHIDAVLIRSLGIDAEGRKEIVGDFYPRFVKLCGDYSDQGSSFDAYLFTSLRFFVRTWQRKQTNMRRAEHAFGCNDTSDLSVCEEPADSETIPHAGDGLAILSNTRQRDTVRRQLLICLCKNLPLLDHEEVQYYAALFGIPSRWLQGLESYIHHRRARISRATTDYREHRDRHYAAMLHHQTNAIPVDPDTTDQEKFHRRRWEYYRRRLQRQTVHLTNREVAALLGIPKGSVDSALSNLSRRLAQQGEARIGFSHAHHGPSGN